MSLLCANVFTTILYVLLAIFVLLFMVLIHELGHYVIGKLLGFKITEFSIGFGKAIFQKVNKSGEKISLRIFPLGGYCSFEGEDDYDDDTTDEKNEKDKTKDDDGKTENLPAKDIIEDLTKIGDGQTPEITPIKLEDKKKSYNPNAFNNQKPWKRILVFAAGVSFNFISAIIFSFILLLSYGYDIQKVSGLNTNYATLYGDLQVGDVIWAVDGTDVNFAFTGTLPNLLKKAGVDKDITLRVNRDGKDVNIVIRLANETKLDEDGKEITQIVSGFTTTPYAHSFLEALGRCFVLAFGFAWVVLKTFFQIITGQIAFSQLGGSISTIAAISSVMQSGLANFLVLLPLLAANLAVFNFLPIPALDGAHAVFALIEWIRGKPINRKVENYIHFYGLVFLLLFVVVVDIVHIIVVGI